MSMLLQGPEVIHREFEDVSGLGVPVMLLRWETQRPNQTWKMPDGMILNGPAPDRFGFRVQRTGADTYCLRVVWNRAHLCWPNLNRARQLSSDLVPLLAALGTDLWCVLDQPLSPAGGGPRLAA